VVVAPDVTHMRYAIAAMILITGGLSSIGADTARGSST
jgi:hypothetical protein